MSTKPTQSDIDQAVDAAPTSPLDGTVIFDAEKHVSSSVKIGPKIVQASMPSLGMLGDYELLGVLGRGGMGVVYRARQQSLNRIVALKTLHSSTSLEERDILRFQNEAESAANLRHPGIVAVYDVGEANGRHYYSMEYIEGIDLSHLIKENSLPGKNAAQYVMQLAQAVHYAHEQGVLHRDLKPSNVLLDSQGKVKITDFGLAKRVNADSQLTGEFTIMGTPSYMPPEQAMPSRGSVGPCSDVYALGAILYELITARPPFRGDNPMETIRQVVNDEPIAPRLLNPGIAQDLQTICLKCLEKEPSRRYDSAKTVGEELERYLKGKPILVRPISRIERLWRLCKRHPREASLVGLIAAAVALGSLGIAWQWRRAEKNLQTATRNFQLLNEAADEMLVAVEEWVTRAPLRSESQKEKLNTSLRLFEAFLREEPANEEAQRRLAETHERVAEIRRLLRQLSDASNHYLQAIDIYTKLNERHPNELSRAAELANAWDMLGNTEREAERFDSAEQAFENALKIQRDYSTISVTPQRLGELAKTLYNRGLLRIAQNDPENARRDFETSIETSNRAIQGEPNNAVLLQGLARCRINLGVVLRNLGKSRESFEQYDAAIEILSGLIHRLPDENEYKLELAQSHLNRGNLLLTSQNGETPLTDRPLEESERSFQEAIRLLDFLKTEYPNVPEYHIQLANAWNGLGGVQQESGRIGDAIHSWTLAREAFRSVLRLSGDTADIRSRLGLTLANLALAVPRDQPQERVPLLQEACEHQRIALQINPQSKTIQNYLRSHLLSLSRAYLLAGEHANGVHAAEQMAGLKLQNDDFRIAAELIVRGMDICREDPSLDEAKRAATQDDYAGRAITALRDSLAQGTVTMEQLREDEKFVPLRSRSEFQAILNESASKGSTP